MGVEATTEIRKRLTDALYADLVGPHSGAANHETSTERLRDQPSSWYLTGYLAPEHDREIAPDLLDGAGEGDDVEADDSSAEEREPKQKRLFPASMGMSILLPSEATTISATVSFARYFPATEDGEAYKAGQKKFWKRSPRPPVTMEVALDKAHFQIPVENAAGVYLEGRVARFAREAPGITKGTQALSLFIVNRTAPDINKDGKEIDRDGAMLFQVQLELSSEVPILARPNQRDERSTHIDPRALDLQFRDHLEYAVGHNVAVEPFDAGDEVHRIRTRWIPQVEVPIVDARPVPGVELRMEELARLRSAEAIDAALGTLPSAYATWLKEQKAVDLTPERAEVRDHLLGEAEQARQRILAGIELLKTNPEVLQAFQLANEAMARTSRQRTPARGTPTWRTFQLAFLLLNLSGVADGKHPDRKLVELIFFPTGGGKTEAYLGVIAFALVLRRMRGRGLPHQGLGVAVLLRYTLRLLTLDQLERATGLICALEIMRRERPEILGEVRFSIGLWVGRSATANRIVVFKDELERYKEQPGYFVSPMPLERCPWCDRELTHDSAELRPSRSKPERVILRCLNSGNCDFANPSPSGIPLVFVDEQLYQELPTFVIATVDKFAMMPHLGRAGLLFGRASAAKQDGEFNRFYGPLDKAPRGSSPLPHGLLPPEVIVQDELHLITGPLGTMVGLYESAIDILATKDGQGPKLIASTATANRAFEQIQSLYRRQTCVFPPPAVDALETYFSKINTETPGRLYAGVAAPGHPIKRILLRTYVSLLCAAQKAAEDETLDADLRDAYMTLVGYFNALRELGGMRRLVEDDVRTRCVNQGERVPEDAPLPSAWFASREIAEPLELTSRESTGKITETKDRLAKPHRDQKTTDVVLASNMISVGVDIERLGLMVVAGQPKTTSEYIQASSRVGRNRKWPGLVVTCFNVTRPRDRSHYEHFVAYHESFYRFVEAQSVTPSAQRALARGLTGALVSAIRHGDGALTPPEAAKQIEDHKDSARELLEQFVERAGGDHTLRQWALHRLETWELIAKDAIETPTDLTYSQFDVSKDGRHLLHLALTPPEDPMDGEEKFAAPTSMRDVEPSVHLWLRQPGARKERD